MAEPNQKVILPTRLVNKAQSRTPASSQASGDIIPRDNTRAANKSILSIRSQNNDVASVRALDLLNGTVSASIFSFVEIANSGYNVSAYDTASHQFSEPGTMMARSVLAGLDTPTAGDVLLERHEPKPGSPLVRLMFQDARLLPWRRVMAR